MEQAPPDRRFHLAINAYFYSYILILLGVVAAAAGVEESIGHVTDPLETGPALALGIGVAMYLGGAGIPLRDGVEAGGVPEHGRARCTGHYPSGDCSIGCRTARRRRPCAWWSCWWRRRVPLRASRLRYRCIVEVLSSLVGRDAGYHQGDPGHIRKGWDLGEYEDAHHGRGGGEQ